MWISRGLMSQAFEVFGNRCDLVKFAKLRPAPDACRDILEAARAFVDQTQPRVDQVVEGPDSTGGADEWDAPTSDAEGLSVGAMQDTPVGATQDTEDDEALAPARIPADTGGG